MDDRSSRIVEREILLIPPDGRPQPFELSPGNRGIKATLGIGLPTGKYPARCDYYLDGLLGPQHVSGNDQWQALFLAVYSMRSFLANLQKNGWTIEDYEEGCEKLGTQSDCQVSLGTLFQDLGTSE